jgi:hypothetical protein
VSQKQCISKRIKQTKPRLKKSEKTAAEEEKEGTRLRENKDCQYIPIYNIARMNE